MASYALCSAEYGSGENKLYSNWSTELSRNPHRDQSTSYIGYRQSRTSRMPLRGGLKYEFFKAWGNLSIRWGRRPSGQTPPAHRLDESPVGYSLPGWSPPLPGSASPTSTSILQRGPDGRQIFIAVDVRF